MQFREILKQYLRKNQFKTKVVLMQGMPGVGKGSYSELLCKDLQMAYCSPGEAIRKQIQSQEKTNQLRLKLLMQQIDSQAKLDDYVLFELIVEEYVKEQPKV